MSAVKEYLEQQIVDAASKAFGLPMTVEFVQDEVRITLKIEGQGAESPFWRAVQEVSHEQ